MTNDSTKISFIPKNSLIGKDPFLSRRRPRSILGVLAVLFLLASVASYIGLYVYRISLSNQIKTRTVEIQKTSKELKESKVILQAKVFQARTQIGKEILDRHIIVSPLLKFVAESTLQTVHFESFSFKHTSEGSRLLLKGESLSYASLAFQSDVLKKQKKQLRGFAITDVKLTPMGSVSFSLEEIINPSFVLYTQSFKNTATDSVATEVTEGAATTKNVEKTPSVETTKVLAPVQKEGSSLPQKFFNLFK